MSESVQAELFFCILQGLKAWIKNTQTKQIVESQGKGEKLSGFIKGLILFYGIISGRNLRSKGIAFFSQNHQ